MTKKVKQEIKDRYERGDSINKISRDLGVWSQSVRWVLRQGEHLQKAHKKRKEEGAKDYKCGICKQTGHNARTHGVPR